MVVGDIWFESSTEEGSQGSVFYCRVLLRKDPSKSAEQEKQKHTAKLFRQNNVKAIVVDGNRSSQIAITNRLSYFGITSWSFSSMVELENTLRIANGKMQADVLFIDCKSMLPEKELRFLQEATKARKVVAMSSKRRTTSPMLKMPILYKPVRSAMMERVLREGDDESAVVDSAANHGRFSVCLTKAKEEAANSTTIVPTEVRNGEHSYNKNGEVNKLSILLAEDNKLSARVICKLLDSIRFGDDVTVAHNGAEALKALRKRNFDLVLMDIMVNMQHVFFFFYLCISLSLSL